jgi:hypothetical protein
MSARASAGEKLLTSGWIARFQIATGEWSTTTAFIDHHFALFSEHFKPGCLCGFVSSW